MTSAQNIKKLPQTINKLAAVGLVVCSTLTTSFLSIESSHASSVLEQDNYVAQAVQSKQRSKFRGSYSQFLYKLGQRETGRQRPPYNIENSFGFIGKYQFGEALLIDLGYYNRGPHPYYKPWESGGPNKNLWKNRWTGKNGVNSKTDFLRNKNNAQEKAIRQAFRLKWGRFNTLLQQRGKTIGQYLGSTRKGVRVTASGILAAAHLRGENNVVNLLVNNQSSADERGTSIETYLKEFGGFQTPFAR